MTRIHSSSKRARMFCRHLISVSRLSLGWSLDKRLETLIEGGKRKEENCLILSYDAWARGFKRVGWLVGCVRVISFETGKLGIFKRSMTQQPIMVVGVDNDASEFNSGFYLVLVVLLGLVFERHSDGKSGHSLGDGWNSGFFCLETARFVPHSSCAYEWRGLQLASLLSNGKNMVQISGTRVTC